MLDPFHEPKGSALSFENFRSVCHALPQMKGLKYHFKYLLYPGARKRFTRREAVRLAQSKSDADALFFDLASRSMGYGKKVKAVMQQHADVIPIQMERLQQIMWGIDTSPRVKSKRGGTPSSMRSHFPDSRFTHFLEGGAPGLGKKA